MVKQAVIAGLLATVAVAPSRAFGQTSSKFQPRFEVIPVESDNGAGAVAAFWRYGLGCPPADAAPGVGCFPPFDPDSRNQGLLLAKSINSVLPGEAIAEIKGVKGTYLVELGYDLRKLADQ